MSLDARISRAVEDLRQATPVDPVDGLARLRETHRRRRTARVVVAAVVLVLAAAGTTWSLLGSDNATDPADEPRSVRNGALLGWENGPIVVSGELAHVPSGAELFPDLHFSPDGTRVFYSSRDKRVVALDVRTGEKIDLGPCLLFPPGDSCLMNVAPDGAAIAFAQQGAIVVRDAAGDRTLAVPGDSPLWPKWSPDGEQFAFVGAKGVYVVDADGSDLRRVVSTTGEQYARSVAWSPDGQSLAYLATQDVGEQPPEENAIRFQSHTVTVLDLGTGETRELAAAGKCACAGWPSPTLTWSPDGELIAFAKTGSSPGVFTVPATGGEVTQLLSSRIGTTLAWQPVRE